MSAMWQARIGHGFHDSFVQIELETNDFEKLISAMDIKNGPHLISMPKKTLHMEDVVPLIEFWLTGPSHREVPAAIGKADASTPALSSGWCRSGR